MLMVQQPKTVTSKLVDTRRERGEMMQAQKNHKYEDIIDLPHHVSTRHPQMPTLDRAAQFSPFAALTGYEEATKETARVTEQRRELDEQEKINLNNRLYILWENRCIQPQAEITYFIPDKRKEGGLYTTVTGAIFKLDEYTRLITLMDGTQIPLDEVSGVESSFLEHLDEECMDCP